MLTITYSVALCAVIAFWPIWHRSIRNISLTSSTRGILVGSYCLFALALLGDLILSLGIPGDDLTRSQFRTLLAMAMGTMPQVALFAFLATPVTLRGKHEEYPFGRAVLFMESCAAISIVLLAMGLVDFLHFHEGLLGAFSQ